MKNLFAKKTIKILMGVIFIVFIFGIVRAETIITTKETDGGTYTTVTERTYENRKNQTSGFGSGYITTKEVSKSYFNYKGNDADEQDGRASLTENYEDDNKIIQTRSGWIENNYDSKKGSLQEHWDDGTWGEVMLEKEIIVNNKLTYTLLQPLPTERGEPLSENVTLKQYLTWAYKFVLALTGFLAVMMIVIGGVEYIISGANESMRGEAHKRIWGAITGLVLALVAYLVLYTINPSLVNFKDNWFFKPRSEQMQSDKTTQTNSKTTQTNSNINQGVQKMKDLKFDEKGI